ncbi:non-ribosomal peptide synthetase [Xylariales sp. AK1849]|nr:non-ribosomal peptide synthetase [Xylariales sp. AK1849]
MPPPPGGVEGLAILNPHPQKLPGPSLLHELVRSASNNDRPAIDFLDPSGRRRFLSYTDLHTLSDSLAVRISQDLEALPSGDPDDQPIIPLMIPQSPELYIAILAILKSGAAFCPLNLDTPAERIEFILDDINASLVLTIPSLAHRLPTRDADFRILCVNEETKPSTVKVEDRASRGFRSSGESSLAYAMYTSGSTGTPKAVGISHRAVTQSLLAHDKHIPAFSRFLQFAAPTFDVSVFEIFFPLFRGILRKMDVDACELTPSVAGSLLRSRDNAPSLKLVLTIGEMLTQPVVEEFGQNSEQSGLLWGMYGPTEAGIHCTLQPAFRTDCSPKCIGVPLDTVSAFIIKFSQDHGEAQPFEVLRVGEVGELAVGGQQLATGYLNRPEQTSSAFIATDFGRIYKTGDKARILPDGTIECLGRVAEGQVKLNGQRIELGEIEQAILRTPGCHSSFVCVIANVLIAFAAVDSLSGMQERIKSGCKEWLPTFMVPSEFIVLESFPTLPSGKIDRRRLREDYLSSQADESNEVLDYKDDLERLLCEVATQVFQAPTRASTKLSSIGLDSLSAIQLAAQLRSRNLTIGTLDVLEANTVADLYRLAQEHGASQPTNGHRTPKVTNLMDSLLSNSTWNSKADEIEAVAECTALQTSMIVESLKDPRLYVNTVQIQLPRGATSSSVLAWFFRLAQENEILRTGFTHPTGGPVQLVWKELLKSQVILVKEFKPQGHIDIESFLERPLKVEVLKDLSAARILLHHAIYDGWTLDLLLDDLSLLAQGGTLPRRPQFREVGQSLNATTSTDERDSAKEFWAEHLKGIAGSSVPNFKTVAELNPTIRSTTSCIAVNPRLVRQLAGNVGFSAQIIFQASLTWLWGAITGTEDVTFGSVFSGRTLPIANIERVMGPCLSTYPIRSNLSDSDTILDLVRSLHATNRLIMRLGPLELIEIKKAAQIPAGSKLFDIIFVYQESLASRNRSDMSVQEISHLDALETNLLLEVEPRDDNFICQWTWHSDVFGGSQVDNFAQHFCHLVQYFINHLNGPLSSVRSSFPPSSLSAYIARLRPVETCSSLATLIEGTALSSRDAEALCFAHSITSGSMEAESLTYRELNQAANQVAHHLLASGVSPGGIVGIIMEKSPLLYCGILGILKAGCGYLPILPSTPRKRIKLILEQAKPHLCIVDDVTSWNDDSIMPCETTDIHAADLREYPKSNLGVTQDPSQLAYVIFTSGTTGTPKGVSVTNKNMMSNIEVLSRIYPHRHSSRMLQACSQAFDVSVFEIFFAWANGMCLCVATNDTLFEDLELSIRQLKVTHLSMTVTVASLVNPENVPDVTFLVTSGEPMTDEVLAKWAESLYQGYGPSETTNICTVRKVAKGDSSQYLGWSMENTSSFVFYPDSDHIAPTGGIGELCFGGDQVAAGYLNMPDLTASKFFEHPEYGRLYRSGDLGRMLPDGSLIILGRSDSQIKLRGQRIELQEIHTLVLGSGIAKACATIVLNRESTVSRQLALFYVPAADQGHAFHFLPLTAMVRRANHSLMKTLQGALPNYMVPSFVIPISTLPLTSSGKISTEHLQQLAATLPAHELDQCSLSVEVHIDSTEWTDAETQVADVLAETLNVKQKAISRWASFASLGLDSLSAMPLSRKLQNVFGKRIPLSQVLGNANIARLAKSISASDAVLVNKRSISSMLPPELTKRVRQRFVEQAKIPESVLPCTPLQEAMLATSASSANKLSYSNQMLFRLRRAPEELMAYWGEMCIRHGILRTCFATTEYPAYPLVQVVLEPEAVSWIHMQASDLQQCASEHLRSLPDPVDSMKPPLALAAISIEACGTYISFVCHHALYDGVAVRVLLSEIEALVLGEHLPTATSFRGFLQETRALPPDTDDFWKGQFQDFRPLPLNEGRHDLSNGTNDIPSSLYTHHLPQLSTIETRLRELGVSLLSLCQAAWSQTLSVILKTPDVCFGNVLSGRSIQLDGIDRLVAPCFNTIPIRLNLSDLNSNRQLMRKCQQLNATMLQYQFTPLRKIQSLLRTEDTHLFDTLLLLQPPAEPLNEDIWSLELDDGSMEVPIVCEVIPSSDKDNLAVIIHRDTNTASEKLSLLLQQTFVQAIENCLRYPSSQVKIGQKLPGHSQSPSRRFPPSKVKHMESSNVVTSPDESWNEREQQVRAVVAKLSSTPQNKIRRHTSIHRLGLDSISAIQITYLLRQEGLEVPAVDVLERPTCAGIASRSRTVNFDTINLEPSYDLTAFQQSVQRQVAVANLPCEPDTLLPCTPLQQGMISQFILSEGRNYFNFVSWTLDTTVNCTQVADAWRSLVAKHQILRTGFTSVSHPDTAYAMMVYEVGAISPPIKHLAGRQAEAFDVERWHRDCATHALNNLSQPPWQVLLLDTPGSKTMQLSMHHALYDAFSLRRIMNELFLVFSGVKPATAEPLGTAVASAFGRMKHQQTEAEDFWRSKAADIVVNSFPVMTSLRLDTGDTLHVSQISRRSHEFLRAEAAQADVTIQAALQSAWARVLSSYHGELASTFGVVLSGRTADSSGEALFPRITTLPILAQTRESNRELLQLMMEHNAALRRYENTPLTQVQKWTGYPNTPIFDTILVYQQSAGDTGARPWKMSNEKATVDYPISLEIEEVCSGNFEYRLVFRGNILPPEQAKILLKQFDAIFTHLLESPDDRVDDLTTQEPDLFSLLPAEHDQLPSEATLLHHFVELTAARSPDSLALEFVDDLAEQIENRRWSYRELDQNGNRVAHLLQAHGVKSGGIVALCFDKCPEAYFTILGILKSGCAFVALDPSAPASRQEFILQDSGAVAVMVKGDKLADLDFTSPTPVFAVGLGRIGSYSEVLPYLHPQTSPEDACYCLYTSGTTGTPKGCLISHRNAVQAMLAFQQLFTDHWDSHSRWLQFASFHFDVSVLEQYWPWSVGIPVVAAPRDLILSDLISTISKLEITHIDLTPSLARLVHPDDVPSLCKGVFITGGEQLRQDILDVWGSKGVIYNAYGPTEATIGVTMYTRVPQNGRPSNIGKQFPNVGSYVLRPGSDIPVLKGGVGELCVSGNLVGKGYLNRPDLTRERFPTLAGYGERVYRTGDLVRVLHDGCFDFLGRADDQVKLRGQRLEVGEVNHAIRIGVPQVVDVATLVTKYGNQDRELMISFIVTKYSNNRGLDLSILSDLASLELCTEAQDACRKRLPGYMIPTYVFCVPNIPLSANNKAQTSILKQTFNEISPEQLRDLSFSSADGSSILSTLEPQLARVLADITRVDAHEIKSSSTIFELGIDSISVIELARRLRAAGFPGAAPSAILQQPRLGPLARVLKEKSADIDTNQALRIRQSILACYHRHLSAACRILRVSQADVEYIAPCTPLQEGMLSRSASSGGRAIYFNSFQLNMRSDTSIKRLQESWKIMIGRNAILRTRFLQTSDGYVQVALRNATLKWHEAYFDENEIPAYLSRRYEAWVQSNEPTLANPLEIDCTQYNGGYNVTVRIFHGIYDARSFNLILQHVMACYNKAESPASPTFVEVLPHGPLCDYGTTRSFWTGLFEDFDFQPIPQVVPVPETDDVISSRVFDIQGLEARRVDLGVTRQTIVQAAWMTVLRRHYSTWPSVGIVLSGRSLLVDGIESTIGPLFNTLPFRVKAGTINSWTSLIQETHRFNSTVISFSHTPLRQIQKWCSNSQPLFDNLFAFDREDSAAVASNNELWTEAGSSATADYPLAFEGILTKGHQLKVTLVAQSLIANEAALNAMLDGFQRALLGIVSDSDFPRTDGERPSPRPNNDAASLASDPPTQLGNQTGGFVWTDQARSIQSEIATLAGVSNDRVGETRRLFELGLDSIDAVKLVARLRKIGISITTSGLMKQTTIQSILATRGADEITGSTANVQSQQLKAQVLRLTEHMKVLGHDSSNIEDVLPPTPLQDSMVAEMVLSDFQRYFNHDVLEIAPNADLGKLISALETVIENSPILRTSFVEMDDPEVNAAYCQVVQKRVNPFHPGVFLDHLEDFDDIIESARIRAVVAKGHSELLQFTPVKVASRRYIVLSIAHALYDGVSLDLFHQDAHAAYDGRYRPREAYKSTLARIISNTTIAAEGFWANFLHDATSTLLPGVANQPSKQSVTVHRIEATSQFNSSDIRSFCKRHRITPQVLGQACWAAILASRIGALDVIFGVVLSGRATETEQSLMFPTMNTVPVRIILNGTVTEYVQYIWENLSTIYEYQHFPLRTAHKLAGLGGPLFNTLFTMQARSEEIEKNKSSLWSSITSASEVEYPVCVEMEIMEGCLVWRVACDEQYVTKEDTRTLPQQLDQVLKHFMDNEDSQIIDFISGTNSVSICGLPPFTLVGSEQGNRLQAGNASKDSDTEWSDTGAVIADALAEVSGVERSTILPTQSIYHLGLDSISAIKLSSLLRKRGVFVSVRDMVKAASLIEIAFMAQDDQSNDAVGSLAAIEPLGVLKRLDTPSLIAKAGLNPNAVEKTLPALPMQVHMLSVWENSGGDSFYHQFWYELSGRVTRERVKTAWHSLVSEVPMLRTLFAATGDLEIPFIQITMRTDHLALSDRDEKVNGEAWHLEGRSSPFVSFRISNTADGLARMKLKIHHALYDGVSLAVIANRFRDLCGLNPPPVDHFRSSWDDFVLEHYSDSLRIPRKKFWLSYLRGSTSDRHQKRARYEELARIAEFRPATLTDVTSLRAVASKRGVSLQSLFFAAYAKILASPIRSPSVKEDSDVVFGVYLANRLSFDERFQNMPFPTLSIVPLRVKIEPAESIIDIAKKIQDDLAEISSFENASVGLWEIAEWTGVRIDSFVNYLSLPEQPTTRAEGNEVEMKVTRPTEPQGNPSTMTIAASEARPTDKWLSDNVARDAFLDAVDIEVAIRGKSMDVGVFCPSSLLSQTEASALIDRVAQSLGNF